MSGAINKLSLGPMVIAVGLMVACGSTANGPAGSEAPMPPRSVSSSAVPTISTAPPGDSHSFDFKDNQGYTFRYVLSNVRVVEDVADFPPGQKGLQLSFDWAITNTTPGRNYPAAVGLVFIAVPSTACTPYTTWNSTDRWCYAPVAHIGPDLGAGYSIGPGQIVTGTFDPHNLDPSRAYEGYASVSESYDQTQLFVGFTNVDYRGWFSLAGEAVPDDLP